LSRRTAFQAVCPPRTFILPSIRLTEDGGLEPQTVSASDLFSRQSALPGAFIFQNTFWPSIFGGGRPSPGPLRRRFVISCRSPVSLPLNRRA
jgi:hypothetical protein